MFINRLTDQKNRTKKRQEELTQSGKTQEEIKNTIYSEITRPCMQLKFSLASGSIQNLPVPIVNESKISLIQEFFDMYDTDYQFKKGSLYYNAKASPFKHLKAYYKLVDLCERSGLKSFMCFPLRKTLVPCYMTFDTLIANSHILQNCKRFKLDKKLIWGEVLDISCKAVKYHGPNKSIQFQGTVQTDGVGVSILKQNQETRKGGTRCSTTSDSVDEERIAYIHELTNEQLQETTNRCVFIDPGRCIYRYTNNQRAKETKSRKFRKLRQQKKPEEVQQAENELSKFPASTVNITKYSNYLRAKSRTNEVLSTYYSNEGMKVDRNLLPFRKMKLSSIINKKQSGSRLDKTLKAKPGEDSILVMGNWGGKTHKVP
ncbi:hypothetical protein RMATCC62417_13396 [Rhizopus microsporus]|nr:hypothetical protein RMATCC62417_13396 [Rhizopus microsporus]